MHLQKLSLTNVRAFSQADFTFQPGMNLLVGINGAGKSTVLDVLRIMFAQSLPQFTAARNLSSAEKDVVFQESDIANRQGALSAQMTFTAAKQPFQHLIHLPRTDYVIDPKREGEVRGQTYELTPRNELSPNDSKTLRDLFALGEQPFVLFFSAHRSLLDTNRSARSGQAAAFADALIPDRGLNVREFAEWWLVQEALNEEVDDNFFTRRLRVLDQTLCTFLDSCNNLRAVREPELTLVVDKDGETIDVRYMSDGERSMIALVLEIARRLSQANPRLENPNHDGKAIILIDELDLHLHPSWQRTIVDGLTSTFPNCQFICTTHSPLVIGETQSGNMILLAQRDNRIEVMSKAHTYGQDVNWILEVIMDTPERNLTVKAQIDKIEDSLEDGELDVARGELARLRNMLGGDVGEVVRLEATIHTLEALADEVDTEA